MKIELLPVDGLPRSYLIPQDVDNVTGQTIQVEQIEVVSDDAVPEPERPKVRQRTLFGRLLTEEERVHGEAASRLLADAIRKRDHEFMFDEFMDRKRQRHSTAATSTNDA